MLVSSIAPTFPSRWFVPLERTPSNKITFKTRYGMVANPSQKAQLPPSVLSRPIPQPLLHVQSSRTSCDPFHRDYQETLRGLFLCQLFHINKNDYFIILIMTKLLVLPLMFVATAGIIGSTCRSKTWWWRVYLSTKTLHTERIHVLVCLNFRIQQKNVAHSNVHVHECLNSASFPW